MSKKKYTDVDFLVVRDPKDQETVARMQKVPGVIGSNFFEIMKEQGKLNKKDVDGCTEEQYWSQILSLYETSVSTDDRVSLIRVHGKQPNKIPAYSMKAMKVVNGTTRQDKGRSYAVAVQAIQGGNGHVTTKHRCCWHICRG